MTIFLDSALAEEAGRAFALGFVGGVTTNPKLMSHIKGKPETVIHGLCALSHGPVFYQLTAASAKEKEEEAVRFHRLDPRKVVLKIPCTTENLSFMAVLRSRHSIQCAATAVFSAAQAYLACEAGARYLIPYVSRMTSGGGDGPGLVAKMAAIARSAGNGTEILAASLKTPEEVAQVIIAGAHHVTLPLALIEALGNDPRSDEAIEAFARSLKGA